MSELEQRIASLARELGFAGVGFAEAGRVWLDDADDGDREIAVVGGGGLRFGLPPDYSVRLRFDVGFGHDEWGVFFAFNEAF